MPQDLYYYNPVRGEGTDGDDAAGRLMHGKGKVTTATATITQTHYRWRADTSGLNATPNWLAAEDTIYDDSWYAGQPIRLRFQKKVTGASKAVQRRLKYATALGGPYTTIPVYPGSPNTPQLLDSAYYADEDVLNVQRLASPGGNFINGRGKDTSATTSSTTFAANDFSEDEWCLIIPQDGATWYLREYDGDSPFDSYSVTAQVRNSAPP